MEMLVFYNNNENDLKKNNLIIASLDQIRAYYTKEKKKKRKLIYTKGEEIDLMNVLMTTSESWLKTFISDFKKLNLNEINQININKSDFDIIKYLIGFYWHNMPFANSNHDEFIYSSVFNIGFKLKLV